MAVYIFKNNGRRWPLAVYLLTATGRVAVAVGRGRGGRDGPAVTATSPKKNKISVTRRF